MDNPHAAAADVEDLQAHILVAVQGQRYRRGRVEGVGVVRVDAQTAIGQRSGYRRHRAPGRHEALVDLREDRRVVPHTADHLAVGRNAGQVGDLEVRREHEALGGHEVGGRHHALLEGPDKTGALAPVEGVVAHHGAAVLGHVARDGLAVAHEGAGQHAQDLQVPVGSVAQPEGCGAVAAECVHGRAPDGVAVARDALGLDRPVQGLQLGDAAVLPDGGGPDAVEAFAPADHHRAVVAEVVAAAVAQRSRQGLEAVHGGPCVGVGRTVGGARAPVEARQRGAVAGEAPAGRQTVTQRATGRRDGRDGPLPAGALGPESLGGETVRI